MGARVRRTLDPATRYTLWSAEYDLAAGDKAGDTVGATLAYVAAWRRLLALSPCCGGAPPILIGSHDVPSGVDYNPPGLAEAFAAVAGSSGGAARLDVFLDAGSRATQVVTGIYSDAVGHPGDLLDEATTSDTFGGAWVELDLPSAVQLAAGTPYWIAILSSTGAGTIRFRDGTGSGANGATDVSARTDLADLPARWQSGAAYHDGPLAAFVLP